MAHTQFKTLTRANFTFCIGKCTQILKENSKSLRIICLIFTNLVIEQPQIKWLFRVCNIGPQTLQCIPSKSRLDWIELQPSFNSRQTNFKIIINNNYLVGKNLLTVRLSILNNLIHLNDLNLSPDSLKVN